MRCKLSFLIFILFIAAYGEKHPFLLSIGSAYVSPLNVRDTWESFPVFGGGIQCPSDDSMTTIGFSAYYGNLRSPSLNMSEHPIICAEACFDYRILRLSNGFSVHATAALLNWSVKQADDVTLKNISLIAS